MRMSVQRGVRRIAGRVASNERAVANARAASVELSRRRVERDEVELYLRDRLRVVPRPGAAIRPA